MTKWTKSYRMEYDKKYNELNRATKQSGQAKRRKEVKEWFIEYKFGLKCSRCPETHHACLQFHHETDKKYAIADMVCRGMSKKSILNEIKKCIVLCANCHMKHHFEINNQM